MKLQEARTIFFLFRDKYDIHNSQQHELKKKKKGENNREARKKGNKQPYQTGRAHYFIIIPLLLSTLIIPIQKGYAWL